jgi:hypothetical protein
MEADDSKVSIENRKQLGPKCGEVRLFILSLMNYPIQPVDMSHSSI